MNLDDMTLDQLYKIVSNITYKDDWWLTYNSKHAPLVELEWHCKRPDSQTLRTETGDNGPFYINLETATEESVVRQIWDRVVAAEIHEAREFFSYGDERPFWPHHQLIKPLL